jgi:hypothetical protein
MKIKFVYYKCHVCRVVSDRNLVLNHFITIEITSISNSPSYHIMVQEDEFSVAAYW